MNYRSFTEGFVKYAYPTIPESLAVLLISALGGIGGGTIGSTMTQNPEKKLKYQLAGTGIGAIGAPTLVALLANAGR